MAALGLKPPYPLQGSAFSDWRSANTTRAGTGDCPYGNPVLSVFSLCSICGQPFLRSLPPSSFILRFSPLPLEQLIPKLLPRPPLAPAGPREFPSRASNPHATLPTYPQPSAAAPASRHAGSNQAAQNRRKFFSLHPPKACTNRAAYVSIEK